MAANKRKQDEKHLKILRDMASLTHNKQCFDCGQRGPTYVNMTIGSFVCTACSGILRGINPPQRVKSISMTSFTADDLEYMRCHGNDFCRKVWLGLFDPRSAPDYNSKDEQTAKDFMAQKYEKKRWYVAPTEALKQEAKHMNEPKKEPETKSLRSLLGSGAPRLVVQPQQSTASASPAAITPLQRTASIGSNQSPQHKPPGQVAQLPEHQAIQKPSSGATDLLGDLGGDPFAAPAAPASNAGGFADFANFSSSPTAPLSFPASAHNPGLLQPLGGPPSFSNAAASSVPPSHAPDTSGDKYSTLGDLFADNAGPAEPVSTNQIVNWDSSGGGTAVNWNSSGGGVSTGAGGLGWNGTGGSGWGGSTVSTASFGSTTSTAFGTGNSNPFGATSVSTASPAVNNPFMVAPQPASNQMYGQAAPLPGGQMFGQPIAPQQQVGMFVASGQMGYTQQQPAGQFGVPAGVRQAGFVQAAPAGSVNAGFGTYPPGVSAAGFTATSQGQGGQFGGMQNGAMFGHTHQQQPQPQTNWTQQGVYLNQNVPAGSTWQPQPSMVTGNAGQAQNPMMAAAQQSALGMGGAAMTGLATAQFKQAQQPQQMQWGQQVNTGNPFMNAAAHQQIPPRSNSTNPFL